MRAPYSSLTLALLVVSTLACSKRSDPAEKKPTPIPHRYVGGALCMECHPEQTQAWSGSHHDRAMEIPSAATVQGDFSDAEFQHNGVTTRFSTRDDAYWIETDGPNGEMAKYRVAYTFGVEPLQQYLIQMPDGRMQALSIVWDTRPAEEGGQRWYHLYPDEDVDHEHVLHWTRGSQNWNFMCADCHSTALKKNYDTATKRYSTTFTDEDVSCEACHGPGNRHATLAALPEAERAVRFIAADDFGLTVAFHERRGVAWQWDPAAKKPVRSTPRTTQVEIDTCARCHARRGALDQSYDPGDPFLGHYRVSLLTPDLYHPDGQIEDEVYVYGSFLQSKMYQAGVTCSDCHDPHSNEYASGNAVCIRCHDATTYDATTHHHHVTKGPGGSCVSCHMGAVTYMGVDVRRDHSFRVPSPALSVQTGAPNTCSSCHTKEGEAWLVAKMKQWYGDSDRQHFGRAFHAAETQAIDAEVQLLKVIDDSTQPGIVRGTALSLLAGSLSQRSVSALERAAKDPDPLVRFGLVMLLRALPPQEMSRIAAPLLEDPVRLIRTETASRFAALPASAMDPRYAGALQRALAEHTAIERFNSDRPESLVNLANLAIAERDVAEARRLLEEAREVNPQFIPATVNLADLLRSIGDEASALALLGGAVTEHPTEPDLRRSFGLALVRAGDRERALKELAAAHRLSGGAPPFTYVYAVALNSMNRGSEALKILRATQREYPGNRDVLLLLMQLNQDRGDLEAARGYAEILQRMMPGAP